MSATEFRHAESSDGTAIAYRVIGPRGAPWMVLSNGVGCSDEYWQESFIPRCRPWARILLWNYRGHYASRPAADPQRYRIEDHADDLQAVLDAAGVDEAIFVAFSMGVQVTLEVHKRDPQRFRAAVLISGAFEAPLGSVGGTTLFAEPLNAVFRFGARHPRFTQLALRATMGHPLALEVSRLSRFCEDDVPRPAIRRFLRRACREIDPTAYMNSLAMMGDYSGRAVLPTLDVPVLVIAGTEDTMTPLSVVQQMHALIPNAELRVAAGGRHTLIMSRGAWIANEIKMFLKSTQLLA